MTSDPQLEDQLASAIGHYVTFVAEQLLKEGLPVTGVHAYADHEEISHPETDDVEGGISFSRAFQFEFFPGGEVILHWTGTSGWCLCSFPPKDKGGFYDNARWLGAGLLPSPERVAAFVSTVRLDPANADSGERPFYRRPREDFPALLKRLAAFTPRDEQYRRRGHDHRFRSIQGLAYRGRVIDALVSTDDTIVDLPIRRSELRALIHLIDYAEAAGAPYGVEDFVTPFRADLTQRIGGSHDSVRKHRQAITHAHTVRQRMEEQRRVPKPDPEPEEE
jgi:hypothetical protein